MGRAATDANWVRGFMGRPPTTPRRCSVAAREGEAGRQDRVDPAQLPGLRQVPHQGER